MNENIDLTKILKDCPKGWKLYTPLFGEVVFEGVSNSEVFPIATTNSRNIPCAFTKEGFYNDAYTYAECLIFPSKEQRDWSKFTAPWYKKEKFDPKTLKPFDKVLVRDSGSYCWRCAFFSHIREEEESTKYIYATTANSYAYCIPYNEDTAYIVGTKDEPSDYYRYWEE